MFYSGRSNDFYIGVRPIYLRSESSPRESYFVWAYDISIKNEGKRPAQLLNRYWEVVDGNGNSQSIEGPGVVGNQPLITPEQSYEYSSFTMLPTKTGFMHGHYEMLSEDDETFKIQIPKFLLTYPAQLIVSQELH